MNKKLIRLTESDLHRIVKESANKVIKEFVLREPDDDVKKIVPLLKQAKKLVREALSQLNGEHDIRVEASKGYQSYIHGPGNFEWSGGIYVDDEIIG